MSNLRRLWFALFPPPEVRLARAIERILNRHAEDAQEKLKESWYWGPVGGDVFTAMRQAGFAIDRVEHRADLDSYLAGVEHALAEAHEEYRRNEFDEGGYGSATFHAIRRDIKLLRERRRL
jgi:hypothetical protein